MWERCDIYKHNRDLVNGCKVQITTQFGEGKPTASAQIIPCKFHKISSQHQHKEAVPSVKPIREELKRQVKEITDIRKLLNDGFSRDIEEIEPPDARLGLQLFLMEGDCSIFGRDNMRIGQPIPEDRRLIMNFALLFSKAMEPWKVFITDEDCHGLVDQLIGSQELIDLAANINGDLYVGGIKQEHTIANDKASYVLPDGIEQFYLNRDFRKSTILYLTTKDKINKYCRLAAGVVGKAIPCEVTDNLTPYFEAKMANLIVRLKNQEVVRVVDSWTPTLRKKGFKRNVTPRDMLYPFIFEYLDLIREQRTKVTMINYIDSITNTMYEERRENENITIHTDIPELITDIDFDAREMSHALWTHPVGATPTFKTTNVEKLGLGAEFSTILLADHPGLTVVKLIVHDQGTPHYINSPMGIIPTRANNGVKNELYNSFVVEGSGGWCGYLPIAKWLVRATVTENKEVLTLKNAMAYVLKACKIMGIKAPDHFKFNINSSLPLTDWLNKTSIHNLCDFFCIPLEMYAPSLNVVNGFHEPAMTLISRNFRTDTDVDPLKLSVKGTYLNNMPDRVLGMFITANHVVGFTPRPNSVFLRNAREATQKLATHVITHGHVSNCRASFSTKESLEMGIFNLLLATCSEKTKVTLKQRKQTLAFTGCSAHEVISVISLDALPYHIAEFLTGPKIHKSRDERLAQTVIVTPPFKDSKNLNRRIKVVNTALKSLQSKEGIKIDNRPELKRNNDPGEDPAGDFTELISPEYEGIHKLYWGPDAFITRDKIPAQPIQIFAVNKSEDGAGYVTKSLIAPQPEPEPEPIILKDILTSNKNYEDMMMSVIALSTDFQEYKKKTDSKYEELEKSLTKSEIRAKEENFVLQEMVKVTNSNIEQIAADDKKHNLSMKKRHAKLREEQAELKAKQLEQNKVMAAAKEELVKIASTINFPPLPNIKSTNSDLELMGITPQEQKELKRIPTEVKVTKTEKEEMKDEESEEGLIEETTVLSPMAAHHNEKVETAANIIKNAADNANGHVIIHTKLAENNGNPALLKVAAEALAKLDQSEHSKPSLWLMLKNIITIMFKKLFYGPGVGSKESIKTFLIEVYKRFKSIFTKPMTSVKNVVIKLACKLLTYERAFNLYFRMTNKCHQIRNTAVSTLPLLPKMSLKYINPALPIVKKLTKTVTIKVRSPIPMVKQATVSAYSALSKKIPTVTPSILRIARIINLHRMITKIISNPIINAILRTLRITKEVTQMTPYLGSYMTLFNTLGYLDVIVGLFNAPSNITAPIIDYEGTMETDDKPCILLKDAIADTRANRRNPFPYVHQSVRGEFKFSALYTIKPNPPQVTLLNTTIPRIAAMQVPARIHLAGQPSFPVYSLVDRYVLLPATDLTLKEKVVGYYHLAKYMAAKNLFFRLGAVPIMIYFRNFSYLYTWYSAIRDTTYHRNKAISSFYRLSVESFYIDETLYGSLRKPAYLNHEMSAVALKGAGNAQVMNAVRGLYNNDNVDIVYRACRTATARLANPLPEPNVVHENTFKLFMETSLTTMYAAKTTATASRLLQI